ncbi:hypothetical protein [Rhodoplanes sp. SY1]|uniref:hypothetical protein n=1 Tax=Rhodoplanes sp. SY1 TaxID=3166646 RepID=UPI0038B57B06
MSLDRRFFIGSIGTALIGMPMLGGAGSAWAEPDPRDLSVVSRGSKPASGRGGRPVQVSLEPIGASVLRIGSPVRFRASSNQAGFGHLYMVGTSGRVVMVVENLPLGRRRTVELPKPGLLIRATAPAGDNSVLFAASRDRLAGFAGNGTTTTPAEIQTGANGLLGELTARLSKLPRGSWGLTTVNIKVVE